MFRTISIQVDPRTASTEALVREAARRELGLAADTDLYIRLVRRSVDARGRQIRINLTVETSLDGPVAAPQFKPAYKDVSKSTRSCHIIGAGPGGLFAALHCIERGIKPIIIERGKDVKARRRDLATISRDGIVNPESNYCFGEGGAGTYSDGKLYTRSTKRGDTEKVLRTLVHHGAPEDILIDAHPHIGTNKLPKLIENIRNTILEYGGEVHFDTKLTGLEIRDDILRAVKVQSTAERELPVQQLILATGHSARDIFELLHGHNIRIEAKPFALGVRAEHPQEMIDALQYHRRSVKEVAEIRQYLPAASYSLVHQVNGRGVYSFCMCPGGIIAPCATAQDEVVTNGWSPSKRNNPYANSGIVVELRTEDFKKFAHLGPLAGMAYQRDIEQRACVAGDGHQKAPAARLADFIKGKVSSSLPDCSYQPGIVPAELSDVLGPMIAQSLREGFAAFGKKMKSYVTNDAVVVATESRTSTPVRIPRDKEKLHHPQITNLFPCGEGAGYAGGIMSAAMDGERCAMALR